MDEIKLELEELRDRYPKGARVELIRMKNEDDPDAPIPGTRGTVIEVDEDGAILVYWDNEKIFPILPEVDCWKNLVGEFTNTVREQILAVRETGKTNMFDVPAVQQIANMLGYHELVIFLIDHEREYANFILTGNV